MLWLPNCSELSLKALFSKVLLSIALAAPVAAYSQGIAGHDDPALRAAARAWLSDEDPRDALWAIGELAANGNLAARQLARGIARRLFVDFPDLSHKDRRALFPPDRTVTPKLDP
ncbi:MAG: hypothetical protein AAF416_11800 [Pseudomonadota bacterium]